MIPSLEEIMEWLEAYQGLSEARHEANREVVGDHLLQASISVAAAIHAATADYEVPRSRQFMEFGED